MVTAKDQSEDVVEAFNLGANDYVTKPIDFPVVLARIATQVSHRRAQAALRDSEARYALAVRGTNNGLWDWDLRTDEVYYSPRWKAMLGYEDGEIGTSPDEWLRRVHPDDDASAPVGARRPPPGDAPLTSSANTGCCTRTGPIAGCSPAGWRSATAAARACAWPAR